MVFARIGFKIVSENRVLSPLSLVKILILFLILPTILAGCMASSGGAPVVSVAPKSAVVRGTHTVRDGESLYLIAWRYGRDFSELAVTNGIQAPYVIVPGQRLSLNKPTSRQVRAYEKRLVKAKIRPQRVVKNSRTNTKVQRVIKSETLVDKTRTWFWPTTGKIVTRYKQDPKKNKGIDIANKQGTPIKATKPGKVVYSGQGLRGYGRLLIIKHDDNYLSAYAHNDKLLVREGQHVTQGETIATMGRSDSNQVKLHFEIRKKGQPVDPLGFLPKSAS